MSENTITNKAHCLVWMRENYPDHVDQYMFTEISESEYIVEWPENRRIITWQDGGRDIAVIKDYPYVD
jgi:hypothetical protein